MFSTTTHVPAPAASAAPRDDAASSTTTLLSLQGPPISKLVPPGQCQFGEDFQPATLVDRVQVSPTSSILRFALPDATQPLQLSTCACILAKATIDSEDVVRPYTPISTNALTGYMDLLVKNYGDQGTMSKYLHEIQVGEITTTNSSSTSIVEFKHVPPNVKIQAPVFRQASHIVMLAGGTGITPMIQALHAILGGGGNSNDDEQDRDGNDNSKPITTTKVTLLYGSQHSQDILAQPLLDEWAKQFPNQLEIVHVLSDEPEDSSWTGKRGIIDQKLLQGYLPSLPSSSSNDDGDDEDKLIFVCGPPPMYQAICGPREEQDSVGGILGEMGYSTQQVFKF